MPEALHLVLFSTWEETFNAEYKNMAEELWSIFNNVA